HTKESALVLRQRRGVRSLVDVEFVRGRDHNRHSIKLCCDSIAGSASLSQARNALLFLNRATNCIPPIVVQIENLPPESFFAYPDTKVSRADCSQLRKRNSALAQNRDCFFQISWRDGNHYARLRLVEKYCSHVAARCPL